VPSFIELHHDIDEETLLRAIQNWYLQTIFRLRFKNTDGEWRQYYRPERGDAPIKWLEISQSTDREQIRRSLVQLAQELERDLDIVSGPLVQIGLVRSGGRPRFMVLVTDHLVTDTFSFFTFFTNLKRCYRHALRDQSVRFSRDVIIAEWAEHLLQAAHSKEVTQRLEYWKSHFLPANERRRETAVSDPMRLGIDAMTAIISERDSAASYSLLSHHGFTLEELCLASLLMAYRNCYGASGLLVRMVANGRQTAAEQFDLTRGLGWFSVQYPAFFRLEPLESHVGFLNAVIQRNRDYVNEREQYGLLRYMNRACGSELASVEDWSQGVAFNFLGDLDPKSQPDDPFWLYKDGLHALLEFTQERQDHDRGFRFFVLGGRLHIQVLFRKGAFADKEMAELLQRTEDAFLQFISRLASGNGPEAVQREEHILVERG
jgi:hypothetical protein